MKILIRNNLAGSCILETEPKVWDSIVIVDPGVRESNFVTENSLRSLVLRFHDVIFGRGLMRPPTVSDVAESLKFAENAENLLVVCRAGQSRSAALAFAIAYQHIGREYAEQLLDPKRHSPNQLILELAAGLIDDGAFTDTYQKWYTDNSGISLTNHLDELECEYAELESAGFTNRILVHRTI